MKFIDVAALKLTGIAGGAYLLSKVKEEWGQRFLYDHLKQNAGLPAKLSQWLEQKWDVQSKTTLPLIEGSEVIEILRQEVPSLFDQIVYISENAWVASLGQVHKVILKSGEELAIKIQYPGLNKVIFQQVDQLLWMMEKSPARNFGFRSELWRHEFNAMLGEELNYSHEAQRQLLLYKNFKLMNSNALIAQVYPQWCTQTVLVQEWVESTPFEELKNAEKDEQEKVATELARLMIQSLLSHSLLHGDLQPKNWGWCRKTQRLILYDFGSCIEWSPTQQRVFESLVVSLRDRNQQSPFDLLVALGFEKEKLLPINAQLSLLTECLLEPFWDLKAPRLSQWKVHSTIQNLLGESSWYFRTAGPPWFLWLMRSLGSWFYALEELYDRIPLAQIFIDEQKKLNPNRWNTFSVPSHKEYVESQSAVWSVFKDKAQCLRVRVREGNEDHVLLKFPIHLVNQIEDLLSPEVSEKIKEQNLDVSEIKLKALRSGLIKQDLFKVESNNKLIHVWIE